MRAGIAQDGLMLKTGTVEDATISAAPSSTKNRSGERHSETHQPNKSKPWHLGMKAHIEVDADSGLVLRRQLNPSIET
jgi:transposase, IS5 family